MSKGWRIRGESDCGRYISGACSSRASGIMRGELTGSSIGGEGVTCEGNEKKIGKIYYGGNGISICRRSRE